MNGSEQGRSRDIRAAVNEHTFREINEQLVAAVALDEGDDDLHDVVCECARVDCGTLVPVTVEEYDGVREVGERFIVAPADEHVTDRYERIVERYERYWVVEKLGDAGDVADELDTRDD